VAVVRENEMGDKRLVAYVVLESAALAGFEQPALLAALRKSLPEYMVPAAIVPLPAMPRTPNGKLDRNALPAPNWSARNVSDNFVPAKTSLEEKLAATWASVLGLERVGMTENFFELGGHSLSGLRLVNQLRETLGEHVSLSVVFEAPTVAGMAELLEKKHTATGNHAAPAESRPFVSIVPIDRESRRARRKP
jgi:nonribosomal peptide synthetase DhbF